MEWIKTDELIINSLNNPKVISFLEGLQRKDSYLHQLLWVFTDNNWFNKDRFSSFLIWLDRKIKEWSVFSKNNKILDEIADYMEIMAIKYRTDISNEKDKNIALIWIQQYLYWKIQDINTIDKLNKIFK